jgi:putative transposase
MKSSSSINKHHRFPPEIILHAVWLYLRVNLSIRDVENLLAQRGVTVSYEAIRLWVNKFGSKYAKKLKRKHGCFGDTFFIDEVFIKIDGKQHYLWRAVDQESLPHERSECFWYGEVVVVYLQSKRNGATAKRFFKRILKRHGDELRNIVTDKLRSYGVAHRELIPDTVHNTAQYANNRAEQSQSLPRFMGMRRLG